MTDPVIPPAEDAAFSTLKRLLVTSVVRHFITATGTFFVVRGVSNQETIDAALDPLANEIIGAVLVTISLSWAQLAERARHIHFKKLWKDIFG